MSDGQPTASQRTVAVIGLGMIGGSLARDLSALGWRVLGHDQDAEAQREAVAAGVVDVAMSGDLSELPAADVVVLAVPVQVARGLLSRVDRESRSAQLIMDTGSTKASIVLEADQLACERFVGSHPLAGSHRRGWHASEGGLFRGARVFLCAGARASSRSLEFAAALWESLGAMPEQWAAVDHDERLAWTSHLPQVLSTALAASLGGAGISRRELGPGGRDMTRLAAGDVAVWSGVLEENRTELRRAIVAVERELRWLQGVLAGEEWSRLGVWLSAASTWSRAGETTPDRS